MGWFRRRRRATEDVPLQAPRGDDDDWVTVPFRLAEAARVSLHTIGSQKEIPEPVRWWIAQWLYSYNNYLVAYMRDQYGPDIFPILNRITESVMPGEDDLAHSVNRESWEKWERQLREEDQG